MGDPHGLVELSLYGIVVALALPMLDQLSGSFPHIAIALGVLLLIPAPLWLASLRFSIPDRLVTAMVWHSTIAWIAVLGVFVVLAVVALYRLLV